MKSSKTPKAARPETRTDRPLPCEAIQALMLEYMQRGLGEGRSDVIREHTRRCETCRERMSDLQNTLGLLDAAFPHGSPPDHLSDRHRARLARALMHPMLDWVYVHHILVSALVATLVIAGVVAGLRRYKVWKEGITDPGISVTIGEKQER